MRVPVEILHSVLCGLFTLTGSLLVRPSTVEDFNVPESPVEYWFKGYS